MGSSSPRPAAAWCGNRVSPYDRDASHRHRPTACATATAVRPAPPPPPYGLRHRHRPTACATATGPVSGPRGSVAPRRCPAHDRATPL